MVQELGYESCSMYPAARQSPYNMNSLPTHLSGYGQQAQCSGPDYTMFPIPDTHGSGLQHHTASPVSAAAGWTPYGASGGHGGGGGVVTSSRSNTHSLEEWTNYMSGGAGTGMPMSTNQGSPSSYNYGHHRMAADMASNVAYPPHPSSHSPMPNSSVSLGQSPSPTAVAGQTMSLPVNSPQSNSTGSRQRPPYDWMKKQAYQSVPAAASNGTIDCHGKTRTKDKYRIVYSEYQKVELEKEYLYSKYITIQRKAELARSIGLSERQVKIWFQNRRAKERKTKRKREEAMAVAQSTTDMNDSHKEQEHLIHPVHIKAEGQEIHAHAHAHAQQQQTH